jgi:MFS family permease
MNHSEVLTATKAPGGKEGLVLVLASSLTIMGAVMIAPVLPKIGAEFGPITPNIEVLAPMVLAIPSLAIALFSPLAGWFMDHFGKKLMLLLATLLYAVFGVIPAFLHNLGDIVSTRALFGICEAIIMTSCGALIADYWSGKQRLYYINMQVISIGIVGSLFFVIGGVLGENSWRTPFYLYGLPLLLLPFIARVLREPTKQARSEVAVGRKKVNVKTILTGYVMVFFGMVMSFVVPIQSPRILVEMGVDSTTMIGAAAGMGLLATLAGSLLWPFFRDYMGIMVTNAVMFLIIGIGVILLSKADSYNMVMVAVMIHGVGAGFLMPNIMAPVMNALTSTSRGRGIGGLTSCLYLGQFFSPLIVIMLIGIFGSLSGSLQMLAWISMTVAFAWMMTAFFINITEDSDYYVPVNPARSR